MVAALFLESSMPPPLTFRSPSHGCDADIISAYFGFLGFLLQALDTHCAIIGIFLSYRAREVMRMQRELELLIHHHHHHVEQVGQSPDYLRERCYAHRYLCIILLFSLAFGTLNFVHLMYIFLIIDDGYVVLMMLILLLVLYLRVVVILRVSLPNVCIMST